jgi:hypothetical protein
MTPAKLRRLIAAIAVVIAALAALVAVIDGDPSPPADVGRFDPHVHRTDDPSLPVTPPAPGTRAAGWLPGAQVVAGRSAGSMVPAGAKIVWHTTEGGSAAGAIGAYRSHGGWPQLTLTFERGRCELYQHMSLDQAGRALEHPAGTPETNRANVTQVELVGRAADSPAWSANHYRCIATLARQIEAARGVPSRAVLPFRAPFTAGPRLSGPAFVAAAGHLGHQHVPSNHHTDPGRLRMDLILAPTKRPISTAARRQCQELNGLRKARRPWTPAQLARAGLLKRNLTRRAYVCVRGKNGKPGSIRRK